MKRISICVFACATIFTISLCAQGVSGGFYGEDRLNVLKFSGNTRLPLKFERDANGAYLRWQTNAEQNTSHFELQLSYDNQRFETFSKVAASDMTNWLTCYSMRYRRIWLSAEKIFYRVRTVFIDGTDDISGACTFEIDPGKHACFASVH